MLKIVLLLVIYSHIKFSISQDDGLIEKSPVSFQHPRQEKFLDSCRKKLTIQNKNRDPAICSLRDVIEDVPEPDNVVLKPNKVLLKKCTGSCSKKFKCVATETRNKTIYFNETNKITGKRKCLEKKFVEDKKCKCACPKLATDCKSFNQEIDIHNCKCKCKNVFDCIDGKKWNEETCTCKCLEKKPCTSNSKWDETTCRCKKLL